MKRKTWKKYSSKGWYACFFALISAAFAESFLRIFSPHLSAVASAGRMAASFLTLFLVYYFASISFPEFKESRKNLLTLSIIVAFSILIMWAGRVLAAGVSLYQGEDPLMGRLHAESLYFAIPFATAALVLQAIIGPYFSLIAAITLTLLTALYLNSEIVLAPYVLVTSLVATLSIVRLRSRSAYIKAGFNISLVSIAFALASILIRTDLSLADVVFRIGGACLGGIICTFIAAGITPVFEYLGSYVTDMRLLEMATLDHPLLKELSIQAPGTWNHSMVMGMMAEAAADAVGANATIARVGAYFHDIGKVRKPLYFVENQGQGENRHEKLSPSMSSLIIRSHVKDGIELARQYKLPQIIIDMIPQHHGSSLVEYFYDKAVKEAEGTNSEPDVNLYTYPGPKPQSKEAGILMLADGIEAASRTISEPNFDRIQGLVQKMINKQFRSGELDECDLTLKELHVIAKCFTRILSGIYHQRVAYAEPAEKISEKASKDSNEELSVGSEEDGHSTGDSEEKEEHLKRLGQLDE